MQSDAPFQEKLHEKSIPLEYEGLLETLGEIEATSPNGYLGDCLAIAKKLDLTDSEKEEFRKAYQEAHERFHGEEMNIREKRRFDLDFPPFSYSSQT